MIDNSTLLMDLLTQQVIRMQPGPFLDSTPPRLPDAFSFERVEGMLLGLAVGDALGNTSESMHPSERQGLKGVIQDYLPNKYAAGQSVGLPSDDTQMAFWTLEQLLADDGLNPDHLAARFCQEPIFGIGSAVREFIGHYKVQKIPWQKAGSDSAGNGALMRIAPVLVPHLRQPSTALWADAALAGMVTHNDGASNAACVAFINLLWQLLAMDTSLAPDWWLETYIAVASQLEEHTAAYRPRNAQLDYTGPIWKFTRDEIQRARAAHLSTLDACNHFYSGAYLLETIPCALYILMKHANDPEQAIIRAVNDTRDNDTVAAIVGAAVGALHGKAALPRRWLDGLLGRTGAADDGKLFALIEQARVQFYQ